MRGEKDWYALFWWEVHVSRFSVAHHNWKVFAYTPWLPQKATYQWIYLVYKWVLALYFTAHFFWFVPTEYFFIYMTSWGFTLLTVYLVWSALSVTIRYVQQFLRQCEKYKLKQQEIDEGLIDLPSKPTGCFKYNSLQWYEFIHWILFIMGIETALCISILYWSLLADGDFEYSNLVLHLVNGLIALIEIWLTRLPVRIYHFLYLACLGSLYVVFSGIYFAAGGHNSYNNATYIYPPLDYGGNPGAAAGLAIGSIFLFVPFVHMFFYVNYLLREAVLFSISKYLKRKQQEALDESSPLIM